MLLTLYTCRDAIKRLDDYLDRQLSATELVRVERHLKLCRSCSKKFKFERELLAGIRAKINLVDIPNGLYKRIMQIVDDETMKRDTI